jgi:uncharacterized paraquat-inducible protein A
VRDVDAESDEAERSCPYCRTELHPEATVCPSCGAYERRGKWYERNAWVKTLIAVVVVLAIVITMTVVVIRGFDHARTHANDPYCRSDPTLDSCQQP